MLDFKKLAEVTSIEELPEGINVLVNDNGVVKQVPANKVGEMVPDILKKAAESGDGFGYTDGDELHQIDSKYIKKEEIVPEEVSNAVETHGMGYTTEEEIPGFNITWDGNTEGRETYEVDGIIVCKIQDEPISKNRIIGAMMSFSEDGSIELSDDHIEYLSEDAFTISTISLSVFNDTEIADGVVVPKGLYFFKAGGVYVTSITKEASTQEVVHQIDEKYIPSEFMVVKLTEDRDGNLTADKTFQEIYSACPNVVVELNASESITYSPSLYGFTSTVIEFYLFTPNIDYDTGIIDGLNYAQILIKANDTVSFTEKFKRFD